MKYLKYGFILLSVFLFIGSVQAERIKDIASIEGMCNNQLVGYGLVVGLNGTGDKVGQVSYSAQSQKKHACTIRYGATTRCRAAVTSDVREISGATREIMRVNEMLKGHALKMMYKVNGGIDSINTGRKAVNAHEKNIR